MKNIVHLPISLGTAILQKNLPTTLKMLRATPTERLLQFHPSPFELALLTDSAKGTFVTGLYEYALKEKEPIVAFVASLDMRSYLLQQCVMQYVYKDKPSGPKMDENMNAVWDVVTNFCNKRS